MVLQDYLIVMRKRWKTMALVVLLAIGIASVASALSTRLYESRTQFFVSTSGAGDTGALLQGNAFTQQRVKSYSQLITTPRILGPVASAVGVDQSDLATRVTASTPFETVLIDVAIIDTDPRRATATATALAKEFPLVVTELESPGTVAGKTPTSPVKITLVQPATTPTSPVSPQPFRNIGVGLFVGLLLGFGAAMLRDTLDRTVKTPEDVKRLTDIPLLGSITHDPEATKRPLIVEVDPRSPRAEAFRSLRTNLQFVDAASHPRTLLVTSSLAGEGKSTLTANLALTMSQTGSRVCLIEADLRRPKVLEYMGLEGAVGLTDALIERADVMDVIQPYGGTNLWVLGAGPIPPNPSELLGSVAMRRLLETLSARFDSIIIDAPPTLPVTDAVVLSKIVDGAIVVAGSGMVDREQLVHTLDALRSVNGKVLGVVLNRVPLSGASHYGGYSYAAPEEEATRRERKRVAAEQV